jgi:hypothetical protein
MLPLNRLAGLACSHVMGMVAYAILSPVVVSFTMLILATLGFWLVAGGINEQDGIARILVENLVAIADGQWIDWLWRPELSFEGNALRLFGLLGFVGWLVDLVVRRIRPAAVDPPAPLLTRTGRVVLRLGLLTAFVCLALLAAVLVAPRGPDQGPGALWIVRAVATTAAMGGIWYAATAPAVIAWYVLNELRPVVAGAVQDRLAPREDGTA